MSARGARRAVPFVVGNVLAQSAIAALLVAHGNVALPQMLSGEPAGALTAIVCGVLLHSALPAKGMVPARKPRPAAIVQLGLLLASVAVAEEIIWRGFAFPAIRISSGPLVAFIATTVGFAAMHTFAQGWSGVRTHAVTGAAFGLVFLFAGGLASAIAVHVSYNLVFLLGLRSQRQVIS